MLTTFKGIKVELNYFCLKLKIIKSDMVDLKKNQIKILVLKKTPIHTFMKP